MENNSRKKQSDEIKNPNDNKDVQSPSMTNNSTETENVHRHSKIDNAILTFQLENAIIKLPHLNSFIVNLQIDNSKLIFSPKATTDENNFQIGYKMQKTVIARINNSHSRAKTRKIYISVTVFNKEKKKIAYGKIEINPGSFYGEEKLKLRPISIDLSPIDPCPIFFFGLQLNDIPSEKDENGDEKNSEITDRDIQIQDFELPETLISTKKRTAHRNSDVELMTEEEKEMVQQQILNNNNNIDGDENQTEKDEEETEDDEEFFTINNPDLIAMIEEEEREKQEEIERKKQEEIERKKQEELKRKQEEERKKQEELKRKQEEERKRQEELKRKQEEELKRKEEEERKRKEEELKKKTEECKNRQLEELMQKSSCLKSNNVSKKLKDKLKNKKKFIDCLSNNATLLKNTINAITSADPNANKKAKNYKRSFSTSPKKVTTPVLIFPLKITNNFAFSYSYRLPTDENGNIIENAPFDIKNVELNELNINKKCSKSAFKSINPKSKTTDEVNDCKKKVQTKKVRDEILNKFSNSNENKMKCEVKKIVDKAISQSKPGSIKKAEDLLPFIIQSNINEDSNFINQNNEQTGEKFISDSFVNQSYNSYRNDVKRKALFLLSNDSDSSNSSSMIAVNNFAIDEICAKNDVDNDENGNFRTRYERLQRQSKIKFILAKMRKYNQQNRPQKLEIENLIFHEWTTHVSSDDDDLYEYYEYD